MSKQKKHVNKLTKNKKASFRSKAAILLVLLIIINNIDITAFASAEETTGKTVVSFDSLPDSVYNQIVVQGEDETHINFPDSLRVQVIGTGYDSEINADPDSDAETVPEDTLDTEVQNSDAGDENLQEESGNDSNLQTDEQSDTEDADDVSEENTIIEEDSDSTDLSGRIQSLFKPLVVFAADEGSAEQTDDTIPGVTWKLNSEKSSVSVFSSENADDHFVYDAVIPEGYFIKDGVTVPEITVSITEKKSEPFHQEKTVDGTTISITADSGVFPEKTSFTAVRITNKSDLSDIKVAITNADDSTAIIETGMLAFDITIYDRDGNEIQPNTTKGKVKIEFKNSQIGESAVAGIQVYHLDDELNNAEKLDTDVNVGNDAATVTADHFSPYVVVSGLQMDVNNYITDANIANGTRVPDSYALACDQDTFDTYWGVYIYLLPSECVNYTQEQITTFVDNTNTTSKFRIKLYAIEDTTPIGELYRISDCKALNGRDFVNDKGYWIVGSVKSYVYSINGTDFICIVLYAPPDTTAYGVTVTNPSDSHISKSSGDESQTGLTGAMTDVVYTADTGYYFPANYSVTGSNGINVTRNSATKITVSGTPTDNATVTLIAATSKTSQPAPTGLSGGEQKITGTTADMQYSTDGSTWTDCGSTETTGLKPGNYQVRYKENDTQTAGAVSTVTVTEAITAAMVSVTPASTEYTGAAVTPTVAVTDSYGTLVRDTDYEVSGDTSATAVGTYSVIIKGKGCYTTDSSGISVSWSIAKKAMTGITKNNYSAPYDGNLHSANVTVTDPSDASVTYSTTESGEYQSTAPTYEDAGNYTIYYKITKDGYTDQSGTLSVNITSKDVSVTAENKTKVYGDSDPELTYSVTGVVSGESLSGISLTRTAGEDVSADGYTITPEQSSGANPNYNVSFATGKLTITAKPITVTPDANQSKVYGGNDPVFTYTAAGLIGTDQLTGSLSRSAGESTGTYSFAKGTLANGNYIITLADNSPTFTISPKTITVGMLALSSNLYSYDGTTKTPTVTVSDNAATLVKDTDYTIDGTSTTSAANCGSYIITITGKGNYTGSASAEWQIHDDTAPTGTITTGTNNWNTFLSSITFNLFFKNTQSVTITAADPASGVKNVSYLTTDTAMSAEAVKAGNVSWTALTNGGSFSINPDSKYIVYARLEDNAGNISYISSDGMVLDGTAPLITGLTDGSSYCEAVTFSVTDSNIDTVKVDGNSVSLTGNQYTIAADGHSHTVVATDKAGNASTAYTVSVYNGHCNANARYTASGAVITAECTDVVCPVHGKGYTATLSATDAEYSGNAYTGAKVTYASGFPDQTQSIHYSGTQSDGTTYADSTTAPSAPGRYTATFSLTGGDGQKAQVSASFTISKKTITEAMISASPLSFVYNNAAQGPTVTVTDGSALTAGTDYAISGTTSATDYGTYTFTVTGLGNYTTVSGGITITWKITKQQMSGITLNNYSGVYDGAEHTASVTVNTPADASVSYSSTQNGNYSAGAPAYKDAGNHTFYYKLVRDGYEDATGSLTVTITGKPITVTAADTSKTYGDSDPAFTYTTDGLLSGETLSGITATRTAGESVTAGGYPITLSETAGANPNYNITFVSGKLTITAKVATVTPDAGQSKTFGEADPAYSYKTTGLLGNDTLSGSLSRASGENAGDYAYTLGSLTNSNYSLILASGSPTFRIGQKELSDAMLSLADSSYVYAAGTPRTPVLTVKDGNTSLVSESAYVVDMAASTTTATDYGSYTIRINGMGNYTGSASVTWRITDPTAPTGTITTGVSSWNSFLNSITFGIFFRETKSVTVAASDVGSGVDKVYYLISSTAISEANIKNSSATWTEIANNGSFNISPDAKVIVYAKITDKSGNTTYISSDGMVLDATAPAIAGVVNGKGYCGTSRTVTVADDNLASVTVDGNTVTLTNGSYTIASDNQSHTVIATDKAGNSTSSTFGLYTDHSWGEWTVTQQPTTTVKGSKHRVCAHCGEEQTQDIPTLQQQNTYTGQIKGTISGDTGAYYTVSIQTGNTPAQTLTGFVSGDSFAFSHLADGEYNMVIYDQANAAKYTVTKMVTIRNGVTYLDRSVVPMNGITIEIGAAYGTKMTVVDVESGAPNAAVSGLNELFTQTLTSSGGSVTASQISDALTAGSTVKIALETKETTDTTAIGAIQTAASGNGKTVGMTFDLDVNLYIVPISGNTTTSEIKDTGKLLLIAVPLDSGVVNQSGLQVYQDHLGSVVAMTELSGSEQTSPSGEGFYIADGYAYIWAQRFSTYSIAYTPSSSNSNSGNGGNSEGNGQSSGNSSQSSETQTTASATVTPVVKPVAVPVSTTASVTGQTAPVTAVNAAKGVPRTGDDSNVPLWIFLILFSISGMAGLKVYRRRLLKEFGRNRS